MPKIAIIIKSLNEESNISRSITSALKAAAPYGGEIIVADSGSTDRTVEIAMRYPVTVVQLSDPKEQCCGVGPQLGYQHSTAEYVYILDGDMDLDPDFLRLAVNLLDNQPSIAAVGGIIHEMRFNNLEFQSRARHFLRQQPKHEHEVHCLNGGGLYRRSAIADVSYFSDRNLHGFEEYDLGARLRNRGWRLVRLGHRAADHYSYALDTYALLWRRIAAGRLLALGEIIRAAIQQGYLGKVLRELRPIRFALSVLVYWPLALILSLATPTAGESVMVLAFAGLLPIVAMTARGRSLSAGIYSVVVWHLTAVSLLFGLARSRKPPTEPIGSRVLRTAQAISRASSVASQV